MSEAHAHAPMAMHHDHGWLVVSDASDGVYIKIAKGLGTGKEQSLARLIAAAPDLLEALVWMVENDDTNEGDTPINRFGGASWNDVNAHWIKGLNKARAAIAKATGGAAC